MSVNRMSVVVNSCDCFAAVTYTLAAFRFRIEFPAYTRAEKLDVYQAIFAKVSSPLTLKRFAKRFETRTGLRPRWYRVGSNKVMRTAEIKISGEGDSPTAKPVTGLAGPRRSDAPSGVRT